MIRGTLLAPTTKVPPPTASSICYRSNTLTAHSDAQHLTLGKGHVTADLRTKLTNGHGASKSAPLHDVGARIGWVAWA